MFKNGLEQINVVLFVYRSVYNINWKSYHITKRLYNLINIFKTIVTQQQKLQFRML